MSRVLKKIGSVLRRSVMKKSDLYSCREVFMSDFKKKFGLNLKKLRKSKNITQEKLAELIDLHYRQVSKIETGENFPSSKTIEKICYTLKISPVRLFDFDFVYDGEIILTGTDDIPYYRAIKQGNIVVLEDYRGTKVEEEEISALNADNRFLAIAKNLNKALTVEYFENDKKFKVLTYYPDGTIFSSVNRLAIEQEIEDLMELFKRTKPNSDYVKFVKLAIQSIDDYSALERLESMINGIKLAKGKNVS